MLLSQATPIIENNSFWPRFLIIIRELFFAGLLVYFTIEPIWRKRKIGQSIKMHPETGNLVNDVPHYKK